MSESSLTYEDGDVPTGRDASVGLALGPSLSKVMIKSYKVLYEEPV